MQDAPRFIPRVLLAFVFCLVMPEAPGQDVSNVNVNGTVTDSTGRRVPRPHVTVESKDQRCEFQADSLGSFGIHLPPGTYTLKFRADSFAQSIITNTVVPAGKDFEQEFSMQHGWCSDCEGFVAKESSPEVFNSDNPAITPPEILARPEAEYPAEARKHDIEGKVVLRVFLDATGSVTKVLVIESLPYGLTESAVQAAREIFFKPAIFESRPVSSFFKTTNEFRLHNEECHLVSIKPSQ